MYAYTISKTQTQWFFHSNTETAQCQSSLLLADVPVHLGMGIVWLLDIADIVAP